MRNYKLKWWQAVVIVIVSVSIATAFTKFLSSDLSSLEIFAPIEKKVDFKITDIYNMVDENRQGKKLSQDIVVINVDSCDRRCILDVIHQLMSVGVKAIGLDIYFPIPNEDNDYLLETIMFTENMVSITRVAKNDGDDYYTRVPLSFYEDEGYSPVHVGYANLDVNYSWNVVRTFIPYVLTDCNDTIPSLSLELAKIVDAKKTKIFLEKQNYVTIIDFTGEEIEVISANQLENPTTLQSLSDKIVMIGLISDTKDIYLTPLKEPIPGVLIHAYALQTILSDKQIEIRSELTNWTIAICIGFILVCLLLLANELEPLRYSLNIIIRILIFIFMYLLVYRGCYVFANSHTYADYSKSIMMLAFGTLAFDIVYATFGLFIQLKEKYITIKN